MTQTTDKLLALAEKVASLNPDNPEIGHGMLRTLHSMALDALESHRTEWTEDESHWTDKATGDKYEAVDDPMAPEKPICDGCTFTPQWSKACEHTKRYRDCGQHNRADGRNIIWREVPAT